MLGDGLDIVTIGECTGLTKKQLNALKTESESR